MSRRRRPRMRAPCSVLRWHRRGTAPSRRWATRDRVPLDWAATQNNLGTALQTLGERESGTERLDEAVAAVREALKELMLARNQTLTSGTTGIVVKRLHRRFIGIELSGDFCDMADSRLAREAAGPTLI